MPTGNLPEEAKQLFEKVYEDRFAKCMKDGGAKDACQESAAKQAWSVVKNAGWVKGEDGEWHKESNAIKEFSLRIEKASYDKATGEKRWYAIASDTDEDSYGDSMSLELFQDFISRIEKNEAPPEEFTSSFWKGGEPYLSVAHYPDLEGKAVAGIATKTYIDGNRLKSRGVFTNNKVGEAAFRAVCDDLYNEKLKSRQDKVRISIAFLDYAHKHKSNGYIFERKRLDEVCPECLRELLSGEYSGKIFLKGHLIHEALTRVPVNTRTSMEVERAMTTRKEDAESIIGEELAEEIEQEAKLVGKSEALVIKSDDTQPEEPIVLDIEEEKAVTKKEADCEHPASHYLVVEDPQKPTTWHLRVKNCSGELDHRLMGAAWAALHEGYRGNKYEGPNKEEAITKLKNLYKREGLETPSKADYEIAELRARIEYLVSKLDTQPKKEPHILDGVLEKLKADYDEVVKSDMPAQEKLKALQPSFESIATAISESINKNEPVVANPEADVAKAVAEAVKSAIQPLADQMGQLLAQMSNYQPSVQKPIVPERRSIQPTRDMQEYISQVMRKKSETPNLRAIIERTT